MARAAARLDAGRGVIPCRDQRLERVAVPGERQNLVVVGPLQRVEPQQDVGSLAQRQTEIAPLERDIAKADQRSSRRLLRALPLGIDLDPRERHARLDAPLHVDQRNLHVDGRRQLRLCGLQVFELDDFPGFCARRSRGAFGHR